MNELTREQVLEMEPGRELDKLVMQHVTNYQPLSTAVCPDGTFDCHIPGYSTDIALAWEVVEKMGNEHPVNFEVELYQIMNPNRESFQISPIKIIWYMNPLNICKAALLAVMGL